MNSFWLGLFPRKQTQDAVMNHEAAPHNYINPLVVMQCPSLAIKAKFHPLPRFFLFFFSSLNQSSCYSFLPCLLSPQQFFAQSISVSIIVALNNVIATFLFQRQKQTIMKQHEWAVVWIVDILESTFSICWWFAGNIKTKKICPKNFPLQTSAPQMNPVTDIVYDSRSLCNLWLLCKCGHLCGGAFLKYTCIQDERLSWFSDHCSGVEVRGCFSPAKALCGPTDLSPLFV